MRTRDIPEVVQFLNKMDADCKQFEREYEAEVQLQKAIQRYENVFGVKIKIPLASVEVKA